MPATKYANLHHGILMNMLLPPPGIRALFHAVVEFNSWFHHVSPTNRWERNTRAWLAGVLCSMVIKTLIKAIRCLSKPRMSDDQSNFVLQNPTTKYPASRSGWHCSWTCLAEIQQIYARCALRGKNKLGKNKLNPTMTVYNALFSSAFLRCSNQSVHF